MDMDMHKHKQQALQDLEFIRRVMEETRRAAVGSNPLFFLWGAVIWVEVLLTYGFVYVSVKGPDLIPYIPWVWALLSAAAVVYTIAFLVQGSRRRAKLSTFSDRVIGYLWTGSLVSLVLIAYLSPLNAILTGQGYSYVLPMAAQTVLLAGALFVMGGVYELRSLMNLALAFWVGAVLELLGPSDWTALIHGVVVGTGFLVVGALLRRQAQLQQT